MTVSIIDHNSSGKQVVKRIWSGDDQSDSMGKKSMYSAVSARRQAKFAKRFKVIFILKRRSLIFVFEEKLTEYIAPVKGAH